MVTTTALGVALRHLRERQELTLDELGILSGVNHAYIHRLETGEKPFPSGDMVDRLHRALKSTGREREIVHWLINNPCTPPNAIHLALDDDSIGVEVFIVAATIDRAHSHVDMAKVAEVLDALRAGGE